MPGTILGAQMTLANALDSATGRQLRASTFLYSSSDRVERSGRQDTGGSGSQSAASRSTLLGGFWVRVALYFGPMRVPVVAVQPGFALCVYRPFCCPCVVRSNCHAWVQLYNSVPVRRITRAYFRVMAPP
jgi:hypothetical protein